MKPGARKFWTADRLADRDDWTSGRIEQEASRNVAIAWIGTGAVAMFSAAMFVTGMLVDEFFLLFGLMTAIAAAVLLGRATMRVVRARKFGAAFFVMERRPVAPGETLEGLIETEVPRKALTDARFTVSLTCRQAAPDQAHAHMRDRASDPVRTTTRVVWTDSKTVSARGEAKLGVPVSFQIPEGLPAAAAGRRGDASYRWELEARAAAKGADFAALFILPVLSRGS